MIFRQLVADQQVLDKVSARLEMYLYNGIPPASAPTPRIREPRTTSKNPEPNSEAMGSRSFGEYW